MRRSSAEIIQRILKRAWDEGRTGRVLMIHEARKSARDIPEDHQKILNDLKLFGQVVPSGSVFSSLIH